MSQTRMTPLLPANKKGVLKAIVNEKVFPFLALVYGGI